jgi:hypothetical protein
LRAKTCPLLLYGGSHVTRHLSDIAVTWLIVRFLTHYEPQLKDAQLRRCSSKNMSHLVTEEHLGGIDAGNKALGQLNERGLHLCRSPCIRLPSPHRSHGQSTGMKPPFDPRGNQ